jgi:hypothetical protein
MTYVDGRLAALERNFADGNCSTHGKNRLTQKPERAFLPDTGAAFDLQ